MAVSGGAGATDSAAATPVGRSYGWDCSRSGSRRRFGSKCNPRVNDCRPEGFAIPASRRRLAFTRRPCARDDERNEWSLKSYWNSFGTSRETPTSVSIVVWNGTSEDIHELVARTLFFALKLWINNFFVCLTLAVFSQALPISS